MNMETLYYVTKNDPYDRTSDTVLKVYDLTAFPDELVLETASMLAENNPHMDKYRGDQFYPAGLMVTVPYIPGIPRREERLLDYDSAFFGSMTGEEKKKAAWKLAAVTFAAIAVLYSLT